ncbi:MAG: DUF72 domain-containing protein [Verrucomicrobiae bacterium]|nr:DUF72 domain-containing protein [Verrucomicrobiae bacterium]
MRLLKESVKIGVCGFPASRKDCFKSFHAVEIQQTFYDMPQVTTLEKWRKNANERFDFTIKAWQIITHESKSPTYKRMKAQIPSSELWQVGSFKPTKWVIRGLEKTMEAAKILSAKAIVFQCPPSFLPTIENIENICKFMEKANELKSKLNLCPVFAWEPRGKWDDKTIAEICGKFNLIHVVDVFERQSVTEKSFYFRLHGGYGYDHVYSDDELASLINWFDKYETGYCMFNNRQMYNDARRLIALFSESD